MVEPRGLAIGAPPAEPAASATAHLPPRRLRQAAVHDERSGRSRTRPPPTAGRAPRRPPPTRCPRVAAGSARCPRSGASSVASRPREVSIRPGTTRFTRTRGAPSIAADRVRLSSAAFEAPYAGIGMYSIAASEPIRAIAPPSREHGQAGACSRGSASAEVHRQHPVPVLHARALHAEAGADPHVQHRAVEPARAPSTASSTMRSHARLVGRVGLDGHHAIRPRPGQARRSPPLPRHPRPPRPRLHPRARTAAPSRGRSRSADPRDRASAGRLRRSGSAGPRGVHDRGPRRVTRVPWACSGVPSRRDSVAAWPTPTDPGSRRSRRRSGARRCARSRPSPRRARTSRSATSTSSGRWPGIPALFQSWAPFGGYLLTNGTLPFDERELLILRTGFNYRSPYEWGQHVRIALNGGMSREAVDRVADGPDADGLDRARGRRCCARRTSCTTRRSVVRGHRGRRWPRELDERQLIELCVLVGQYHLVAFMLNSVGVQPEPGLEPLPPRERLVGLRLHRDDAAAVPGGELHDARDARRRSCRRGRCRCPHRA